MADLFHKHLLVKAFVKNAPNTEDALNQWLRDLVAAVNMNVCIEPRSFYVDIPGNEGLTGQIGLSTSHASVHIWDNISPAMIQMDLYSCKDYENTTVLDMIGRWGLVSAEVMEVDRNDGFKIINHYKVVTPS